MPADFHSAAKALALPISPTPSPTPETNNARPPWGARRISSGTRRSPYTAQALTYKEQLVRTADKIQRRVITTFQKLTLLQRILAVAALVVLSVLGILFLVFNERIFGALAPIAEKWRDIRFGWMILWTMTFISAFPPIIGYSSTVTIAGFVYGFPNGYYIVGTATVAGSLASFLASRTILSKYVHRLVGEDKRFEALALTLKHDGLKILVMIRFCPLPYSLSNAAMSTFPTVHPIMFALATALASPKLLIHVFIGSRLGSLAEGSDKMDDSTKLINYASIFFGAAVGIAVGYIIYSKTISRAKELELAEEAEGGSAQRDARVYSDGELDAAALMNADDISLWDSTDTQLGYRDETDDEDVFAAGDMDEEAAIGKPMKTGTGTGTGT